ncbi:MAG: uracil-DNA glycosylase, partial [Psychromonas sp.]|nr:uracil-DNA glycosylase [Psychromonas sp.]
MSDSILEINQQIVECKYCRLNLTRAKSVCGEGPIPSKFMFIAQAPGRNEDQEGEIFIGPSGKVFDILIDSADIKRNQVYITNLVKCFLPKCRKPRQDELYTCYELYLKKEIDLVKPEVIVCL